MIAVYVSQSLPLCVTRFKALPALITLQACLLGFCALHISNALAAANNASICIELNSELPGRIYSPGSEIYEESMGSYYTLNERELDPSCNFRPTSTSEVSKFVKIITEDGTPFAVQTGGHTLFSRAVNIKEGFTVNIRTLNG